MSAKQIICPQCKTAIEVDDDVYASLLNQVRNQEFEEAVNKREKEIRKTLAAEKEVEYTKLLAQKEQEIAKLAEKIESLAKSQRLAVENAEAKKDKEIANLQASLKQSENRTKIAVLEEQQRSRDAIAQKEREIAELHSQMDQRENTAALTLASTREQYEAQLRMKDEQVAQYRDFKAKQSTKAIGEDLEIWCAEQFNAVRMTTFPFAYFEKDNDVVEHTKGDFVFRDYASHDERESGSEYISIMFEMKNEAENTERKHRNEEFFKKLDDDRRKKGCEYAVLVSMLEADSDLYNRGIVDVSYRYPKMFVVRPEFFMPIIGILTSGAREKVALRRELEIARNQSIDVTNFENRWQEFQDAFGKNVTLYRNQFDEAMKRIDDAIDMLQKIKDTFRRSDRNLRLANDKAQNMSIRKLTYKNQTMKAMFEDARRQRPEIEVTHYDDD